MRSPFTVYPCRRVRGRSASGQTRPAGARPFLRSQTPSCGSCRCAPGTCARRTPARSCRPGPGLDRLLRAHHVLLLDLGEQLGVDEGSFFQRSAHSQLPLRLLHTAVHLIFNWPYRRDRRRRTIALEDGFLRFRVNPPLASLPVGLTGWRPPLVRPSPPPWGWSMGFIAVPRTCGRRPIQRLRPGLAEHDAHVVGVAQACRSSPGRRPARGGFRRWGG